MEVTANLSEVTIPIDYHQIKVKIYVKTLNDGEEITSSYSNVELIKTFPFTFCKNDLEIFGDLWIREDKPNNDGKSKIFLGLSLYNMKTFLADMKIVLSNVDTQGKLIEWKSKLLEANYYDVCAFRSKIHNEKFPNNKKRATVENEYFLDEPISCISTSLKAKINLMIKPSKLSNNEMQNFKSILSHEAMSQFSRESNFSIICQGEELKFNKYLLSMISEVFARMILASNSKEALSNSVEIDDFSPDTIRAFQRVAFGNDEIKDEDLTPELLMFAQKYLMKKLVMKIKARLMDSLTNENIFDVIKAAYLIDDQDMIKEASKYLWKNMQQLKGTPEWNAFKIEHSVCMIEALTI